MPRHFVQTRWQRTVADQTYKLTAAAQDILDAGGVFRCSFREGARVKRGVVGSEWTLSAVGDTVTTQDAEAQRILAEWMGTDGESPIFQRDDLAARGDYLDTTFDKYRTQRAR